MAPTLASLVLAPWGAVIAQFVVAVGHQVLLYDVSQQVTERGRDRIEQVLLRRVERVKLKAINAAAMIWL